MLWRGRNKFVLGHNYTPEADVGNAICACSVMRNTQSAHLDRFGMSEERLPQTPAPEGRMPVFAEKPKCLCEPTLGPAGQIARQPGPKPNHLGRVVRIFAISRFSIQPSVASGREYGESHEPRRVKAAIFCVTPPHVIPHHFQHAPRYSHPKL